MRERTETRNGDRLTCGLIRRCTVGLRCFRCLRCFQVYGGSRSEAIGMTCGELGEIVSIYEYHDESGVLLFANVRFEPKGFRQGRPDGAGGLIWDMDGVRRVPYRLPEVVAAAQAGHAVFVCEGEKDVETLRALGLVATTNAGGALKWRPEY